MALSVNFTFSSSAVFFCIFFNCVMFLIFQLSEQELRGNLTLLPYRLRLGNGLQDRWRTAVQLAITKTKNTCKFSAVFRKSRPAA